ncbi:putative ATPase [Dimargaris xerosporica]|nr:putative ATPase [Dimargaris xerosporica]
MLRSPDAADAAPPVAADTEPLLEPSAPGPDTSPTIPASQPPETEVTPTPTKTEKQQAITDYNQHLQQQRFQRLNYLLQKSTVYANFLAQKLEQQQKEQAQRGAAVQASANATSSPRRSGRRGRPRKADGGSGTTTSRGSGAASNQGYQLGDYISQDAIQKSQASAEHQSTAKTESPDSADPTCCSSPSARQPSLVTGGILREYQLAGVEWMVSLYENGLNGILADEMGLGKTLQTISFLAFLRERQVWGPFLVVCPLPTLVNWVREFQRFTPSIPVLLYHGTPEERTRLRRKRLAKRDATFPIVVTTYELVIRDRKHLQHIRWKYIVVDEGHRIKNLNCKLIQELKRYHSANRMLLTGTPLQNNLTELWSLLNFLLPEIFDDPESFQSWFDFDDINEESGQSRIFSEEAQHSLISKLHHILRPFLLRRLKTDVERELPKKREYVIYAPLTHYQRSYYDQVLKGNLREYINQKQLGLTVTLDDAEEDADLLDSKEPASPAATEDSALVMGTMTPDSKDEPTDKAANATTMPQRSVRTRQTRRSTYTNLNDKMKFDDFLNMVESNCEKQQQDEEAQAQASVAPDARYAPKSATGNRVQSFSLQHAAMQLRKLCNHPYLFDYPVDPATQGMLASEQLVHVSGKLLLLDRLLPALFAKDHRVLIFSQMTRILDILEVYLGGLRGWTYCRFDGATPREERDEEIDRFNTDMSVPIFLLSTRSGGLGINLTSADTVILYDSDWNPQMDIQAQDRVHRIGQTKPVIIYRLITGNSFEEHVLERAIAKRKLEKLVIHKGKFKGTTSATPTAQQSFAKMGAEELAEILAQDDHERVIVSPRVIEILKNLEEQSGGAAASHGAVSIDSQPGPVLGINPRGTKRTSPDTAPGKPNEASPVASDDSAAQGLPTTKRRRVIPSTAEYTPPETPSATTTATTDDAIEIGLPTASPKELYQYCLSQLISDADLQMLMDRSPEAYARRMAQDVGTVFKAVETNTSDQNDVLKTASVAE